MKPRSAVPPVPHLSYEPIRTLVPVLDAKPVGIQTIINTVIGGLAIDARAYGDVR